MLTDEERIKAVERITETLLSLGILEFSGDVQLLDWSKSTAKDGPKVKFLLTDDDAITPFEAATIKKGKIAGQLYRLFAIRIDDQQSQPQPYLSVAELNAMWVGRRCLNEEKPFGRQAAELYKVGFFFNPKVMEKVGSDDDYLAWLKAQPCCLGSRLTEAGYDALPVKNHEGDIVPAHVRRIAAGAGTSIKPEYSAVPMCNRHHALQHAHGESAVGGKEYMDRERARHLSRWMAQTVFNQQSMGYVEPRVLSAWASNRGLEHYLPESYR